MGEERPADPIATGFEASWPEIVSPMLAADGRRRIVGRRAVESDLKRAVRTATGVRLGRVGLVLAGCPRRDVS